MSAPAPRLRVVTERRQVPFRIGIIGLVVGALITIAGAALLLATQSLSVAAADGRAQIGNPIAFTADDGNYVLLLLTPAGGQTADDGEARQLDCTVTQADGSTTAVDTESSGSRLTTSAGTEIGSFTSPGGATSVLCAWNDGRDPAGVFYSVGKQHTAARLLGDILLIAGIVVLLVAVAALVIGIRGRAVTVRNTPPAAPPAG